MDRYDEAVKYLTENPVEIWRAWGNPAASKEKGGCLFQWAGDKYNLPEQGLMGCLTQIRASISRNAQTEELTEEIRNDERLPTQCGDITVEHLPLFAEYQRKIDLATGRDRTVIHYYIN